MSDFNGLEIKGSPYVAKVLKSKVAKEKHERLPSLQVGDDLYITVKEAGRLLGGMADGSVYKAAKLDKIRSVEYDGYMYFNASDIESWAEYRKAYEESKGRTFNVPGEEVEPVEQAPV